MHCVWESRQVFIGTLFQVEEQTKREETHTLATEEPVVTTETSQSSEVYTTVVASDSDFNHGDSLYVSKGSENTPATEQAMPLPQSTYSVNFSVITAKLSFSNQISKEHFFFCFVRNFSHGWQLIWETTFIHLSTVEIIVTPFVNKPIFAHWQGAHLVYIFFTERCLWETIEEKATGRGWGTGWIWWIRSGGSIRGRKWTRQRLCQRQRQHWSSAKHEGLFLTFPSEIFEEGERMDYHTPQM